MNIYDIHCHILPQVDDGPQSKEASLKMLKTAKENGISHIFATPHYNEVHKYTNDNTTNFDWLCKAAREYGINVLKGCELYISFNTLDMLKSPNKFTLGNSNYLLVEFSYSIEFSELIKHIYEIRLMGYTPIIAHIERYRSCYHNDVDALIQHGALLQLNSYSILNGGFKTKRFCKKLLKNNQVSFIANDAHKCVDYDLKLCCQYIEKHFGKSKAREIFVTNPSKISETQSMLYA